MIYITSLCVFFILFPIFIAMLKNIIWFFSGPIDESIYQIQLYNEKKKKRIIEFTIEFLVVGLILILFLFINKLV